MPPTNEPLLCFSMHLYFLMAISQMLGQEVARDSVQNDFSLKHDFWTLAILNMFAASKSHKLENSRGQRYAERHSKRQTLPYTFHTFFEFCFFSKRRPSQISQTHVNTCYECLERERERERDSPFSKTSSHRTIPPSLYFP